MPLPLNGPAPASVWPRQQIIPILAAEGADLQQKYENTASVADRDRCKPITLKHMTCACACQCMHVPMQRRCAGARRRAYRGSASESLIRPADRGRCSPITCAPTQVQCTHTCARMGTPIYTSRAAQVSMHTMPLKSTHTHTQTSMPAILSPDAQVYCYHIILGFMVLLFVIVATRTPACSQFMQMRSV